MFSKPPHLVNVISSFHTCPAKPRVLTMPMPIGNPYTVTSPLWTADSWNR